MQDLNFKTDYSHIRIRRIDNFLIMLFVRNSGEEVIETVLDLNKPHELLVPYSQYMFLSYIFCPKQEKVLFVGLGGGAMVQFLKHYDPMAQIDVVEIDPVIIKLAAEYFGVKNEGNVNIMSENGFEYLMNTESQYNAIYIDAFLKPSQATDITGAPLQFYTSHFYKEVQKKLKPDGLVVFNLNSHKDAESTIEAIRHAFLQTHVYKVLNSPDSSDLANLIVIALPSQKQRHVSILTTRAMKLERRFGMNFRHMLNSKISKY